MAEIQSQQLQQKHAGAKRCKKLSTRIDLTPMVDLGFLLITFFVFTTSLDKPKIIKLALPDEHKITDIPKLPEGKSLTLVLIDNNKIGYYIGADVNTMQFTNYSPEGLRGIIIQRESAVKKRYGSPDELMVLIKPTDNASYKNVIETMDEMLINNVGRYMLLDASAAEKLAGINK